jgi:3'(2'), 5'-bisphosphate nucleotidase
MNDQQLLDLAMDLASRAATVIMQVRARGFTTHAKDDLSPVTAADHEAEAAIVGVLRAATPHIPVVAEEEIAAGLVQIEAEACWLVDPLDGTREFSKGFDDFCVCIGLVRHNLPVLGAICAPASGVVWGGLIGAGAVRRDATGTHPISARTAPADGLVVVASRHHADEAHLLPFLAGRRVAEVINMGSALKFCRVAEGRADLYPRFGTTMEWDTAAAQAIVEAAGGSVNDIATGRRLVYGKPALRNGDFVCTGKP